jgi:hypothetical protein
VGWVAGYHTTSGERHYRRFESWAEAFEALEAAVSARIWACPGETAVEVDELIELYVGLGRLQGIESVEDEQAVFDVGERTYTLTPELAAELAEALASAAPKVIVR